MKVLITGGMGVIGAETSRKFVKKAIARSFTRVTATTV